MVIRAEQASDRIPTTSERSSCAESNQDRASDADAETYAERALGFDDLETDDQGVDEKKEGAGYYGGEVPKKDEE